MPLPHYFRRVQKMLTRKGRTRQEAEDLVQDAYLKMQEYCNKGGEIRQPEAFLVRTALRLAINARRDQHLDLYVDESVDELTETLNANPSPVEELVAEECLERMSKALNSVSGKTRDVFFMHRIDGLSHAEISTRLEMSISAVEKHMMLALTVMAKAMPRE
jgi:RNA polymerase sigma factor (sigma-70 family)